jgi:hypothetical protein
MPSGDDLQLSGELSCENAQVRCDLFVGCDLDLGGDLNVANINATNITTTNLTATNATITNATITNATITNATITNATIGTLIVDSLRVNQFAMRELNVPAIVTTPQNNLVIAGLTGAMLIRFQFPGAPGIISLTGINSPSPAIGGYSRLWVFFNRGTSGKTLRIEDNNAGSMPSNRFMNHGSVARDIPPGEARAYYYDEGDSRWVEVS